ncbi:hypothetical protein [Nonomuraea sp. NPDC049684]
MPKLVTKTAAIGAAILAILPTVASAAHATTSDGKRTAPTISYPTVRKCR